MLMKSDRDPGKAGVLFTILIVWGPQLSEPESGKSGTDLT